MEVDRCTDLRPLFPAYACGLLDTPGCLRIQLHLKDGCAPCAARIDRLQHAFQAVPLAFPPQPLPPNSVQAVVGAVGRLPQELREEPIVFVDENPARLAKVLLVLFALALFAAGFWGRAQVGHLAEARGDAEAARRQSRSVREELRHMEGQQQALRSLLDGVVSPAVSVLELAGPGGAGRAFVSPEGFLTLSLGPVTPGEGQLVLWWQDGESWTALGRVPERGGGQRFATPAGASSPSVVISRHAEAEPTGPGEPLLSGGASVP